MNIEVNLPTFNGFYGSIFDSMIDHCIEYECESIREHFIESGIEESIMDKIDIESEALSYIKIDKLYNLIGDLYCEHFDNIMQDHFSTIKTVFLKIDSPKYYNFSNDKIVANIGISESDISELCNYILENADKFESFLKDHFTSRSGFISFYSNKFEDWNEITKSFTHFEDNVYFEYSLLFYIQNEVGSIEDSFIYELEDHLFEYVNECLAHDKIELAIKDEIEFISSFNLTTKHAHKLEE